MIAGQPDKASATDADEAEIPRPDVSHLITEDDTPVDNLFSEKQMRLLTESIHTSWKPGFPFVAMANVGVYAALNRPAIVPDVLVTTHVEPSQDPLHQEHRAYFTWMFEGKAPEIVIEIVSNTKGRELESKRRDYEHMGVTWYAVFDPAHYLQENDLIVFALAEGNYRQHDGGRFGELGLGLVLWEGEFEGVQQRWLRWQDRDGYLLLTGRELAAAEAERATAEAQRATAEAKRATAEARRAASEAKRADAETQRAAALAEKLRELGVDPDSIG